jgi:uncharacterized repeat protein (TIGR01451 family)
MAIFSNQATLTYNGSSTNSNIAYGEILDVLAATKTAIGGTYVPGTPVTYVVTLRNTGSAALTGLTVTDDLEGSTGVVTIEGTAVIFSVITNHGKSITVKVKLNVLTNEDIFVVYGYVRHKLDLVKLLIVLRTILFMSSLIKCGTNGIRTGVSSTGEFAGVFVFPGFIIYRTGINPGVFRRDYHRESAHDKNQCKNNT